MLDQSGRSEGSDQRLAKMDIPFFYPWGHQLFSAGMGVSYMDRAKWIGGERSGKEGLAPKMSL